MLLFTWTGAKARGQVENMLLNRIFEYRNTAEMLCHDTVTNVYIRYYLNVEQRNPLLLMIPTMYVVAQGDEREFVGETWNTIEMKNDEANFVKQIHVGTIPHNRSTMKVIFNFLKPRIYDVWVLDNAILSPLNRLNTRFYKYKVTHFSTRYAEMTFRPHSSNTNLVSGSVLMDPATGRIISFTFFGEYDMIKYSLSGIMGDNGYGSLFPKRCDITSRFKFLGNKLQTNMYSKYILPQSLPDSIHDSHDMALMDSLRPAPLPPEYVELYQKKDSLNRLKELNNEENESKGPGFVKRMLWNNLADRLLNRTKIGWGKDNSGSMKIDPLLNPLYFGYSSSKGIYYKFKVRMAYAYQSNKELSAYLKGGYRFKDKQLYFNVPLRWTFNKARNGYIQQEIGNGNRITNTSVLEDLKEVHRGNQNLDSLNLCYFKDFRLKAFWHYDLSDKLSLQAGYIFHRRTPVYYSGFDAINARTDYRSFAPNIEVQWRPTGWKGIALTADYERGIKGMAKSGTNHERIEADASWMVNLNPRSRLSMRLGAGCYTNRTGEDYFLDFTNFSENKIPGGWEEEWAGEFQLLDSYMYNISRYYVRSNFTYETPLLIAYKVPFIGQFVESEAVYLNMLSTTLEHPYMEMGYSFVNRVFSMGIFGAVSNWKFDGIGFQFGFKLFNRW